MKPTKEQLADPKWWESNTFNEEEYCYFDHDICKFFFSNNEYTSPFEHGNGLELLAKRPEPEFMPKVGEWYEVESDTRGVWKKALYVGVDSIGSHVFDVEKRHLWRIDLIKTLVRTIKTQRDVLIDILLSTHSMSEGVQADAILSSFDLTEKDGE